MDILADPALVQKLSASGVVNHYAFKSEADFTLRVQRGLGGNFGGQIRWAEIHRTGNHKRILRELDAIDDTYLRDFARDHDLNSSQTSRLGVHSPAVMKRSVRRILARNASWEAELELDVNAARILHCTNGSRGNYKELQGLLIVDWDHWPLEIFAETNEIYQAVFAARPHSFDQPRFGLH